MKFRFKSNLVSGFYSRRAFSLIEVTTSLLILAIISSSVLAVINRSMVSVADSTMRMNAFEVARDNMERILSAKEVPEIIDYGESDKYPEIKWQIKTETFSVPIGSKMWLRAVCTAAYTDSDGEEQEIELTHWLTKLTDKQADILSSDENRIIETIKKAAAYVGVDEDTILEWVNNGMLLTGEGYYIKGQLDLYKKSDGNPSKRDRVLQYRKDAELISESWQGEYEQMDLETLPDDIETETEPESESEQEQETKTPAQIEYDNADRALQEFIEWLKTQK